jgi:hypothetical protein
MATDRWDGTTHYWEYSADAPERYHGMDAYKVAEAYVHSPDREVAIGVVLVVSAQDLHGGVTMQEAITRAREHVYDMVRRGSAYYKLARVATHSATYLHAWNGQFIRQIDP